MEDCILNEITANLNHNDELPRDYHLPKQMTATDELSELAFADGALDGIRIYHTDQPTDVLNHQELKLLDTLVAAIGENDVDLVSELYRKLMQNHSTLSLIDALEERFDTFTYEKNFNNIYQVGGTLIVTSDYHELVKLGMLLLERLSYPQDAKNVIRVLGLCNEFTLYAIYNMRHWEDGQQEIFNLAQKVHGWGRIHALNWLKHPTKPAVKDWILYHGLNNTIDPVYSSYNVFIKAECGERLAKKNLSDKEFAALSKVMTTLISGGPCLGINNIAEAYDVKTVLLDYLRHLQQHPLPKNALQIKEYLLILMDNSTLDLTTEINEAFKIAAQTPPVEQEVYNYCEVIPRDIKKTYHYIYQGDLLPSGTKVLVPFGYDNKLRIGTIKSSEFYTKDEAPYPVAKTKRIHKVLTEEEIAEEFPEPMESLSDYEKEKLLQLELYLNEKNYDALYKWVFKWLDKDELPLAISQKIVPVLETCFAATQDTATATLLGSLYYSGTYVEQDFQKAYKYYAIAADHSSIDAMRNLGYCYYYGRHTAVDYAQAGRYFTKGMLHQDIESFYKLGDMYAKGYFYVQDTDLAADFYKQAYNLLNQKLKNTDVDYLIDTKDDKLAYEKSILPDVLLRMGKCNLHGWGQEPNIDQAYQYFMKALPLFYSRRKSDPFVRGPIKDCQNLIKECELLLNQDLI
ncbi:SEL1-like repeat protein [Ligilactobacillus ceti]|uniref:Sel1 repeat family protein n=1 Tax=Ligilactobacillus ceti DSM 22408 TaxID=1122146 RepID=A0A0R2KHJ4_9LACO|nr:SEL1-like repeat protein [Ligilactobacillus ceti]KRN88824.1 hypothetical protein IV53_GL000794 [Ligilactobacillus ceti DSM 22408]